MNQPLMSLGATNVLCMWTDDDPDLAETYEYVLGATAHLLAQMGDQQASLLLEVDAAHVPWMGEFILDGRSERDGNGLAVQIATEMDEGWPMLAAFDGDAERATKAATDSGEFIGSTAAHDSPPDRDPTIEEGPRLD